MQYLMIIMILLSSACQLVEETAQQVKGAYANGDIVFDAEQISEAAVKQCQDTNCNSKTPLSYTLHQVALGNKKVVKVLQFSDLLVSFQTNRTYTCLAPIAPLGKLTLLWSNNRTELCYAQDKDKDYVRQFVVACDKEADWQLATKYDAADMKKFVCQQKQTQTPISSACFGSDNSDACDASSWPSSIRAIHNKVGGGDTATPPSGGEPAITSETKLSEVKIMAEWNLPEATATCTGTADKEKTFTGTSSQVDVSANFRADASIDDFLIDFHCLDNNKEPFVVSNYGDKEDTRDTPPGICVANKTGDATDSLDQCTTQEYYIKITFKKVQ